MATITAAHDDVQPSGRTVGASAASAVCVGGLDRVTITNMAAVIPLSLKLKVRLARLKPGAHHNSYVWRFST